MLAALAAPGCWSVEVCELGLCGQAGAGGGTATTTATATGGGMGDGGAGGGLPAGCTPMAGVAIDATCGVFVQGGATGGGSQAEPVGSIAEASQNLAGKKAIYVCGADTLTGSVDLPGGVSLFGGLDCASWTYGIANPKPTLLGDTDSIALRISGSGTSIVQSMRVEAPNAVAAGASSIAVLAEGATLTIDEADVAAGDAMAGAAGPSAPGSNTAVGATGNNGINACVSTTTNNGGAQTTNTCGLDVSIGGKGGDGNVANGGNGNPGQSGAAGQGGIGQPNAMAWDCSVGTGGGGNNGSAGSAGSAGSGKGTLTSSGFLPADGGNGGAGAPGQGGGGGGGAKGRTLPDCAGASGGSGGAGGCGGTFGEGGRGGGASFALVSVGATITVTASTLTSGVGGNGGAGGTFQPGAFGGFGGNQGLGMMTTLSACGGGDGGQGGNGGGGGGGRGGHSAPVVFSGDAPTLDGATTLTKGAPGAPGVGVGNGTDLGQDGLVGTACSVMDFNAANETCSVI